MKTRLINFKKKIKWNQLSNGKDTETLEDTQDSVIEKLQIYYGSATRANKNCFDDMGKAVWFHEHSTNLHP
jgi:hypothetical protein